MYRIVQSLNNNVALVKNQQGEQAVVMGLGIAFQKKKGDIVVESKIEKVFQLKNDESKENFLTLLKDVPLDFITATYEVIDHLTTAYQFPVQSYLYVTLTDHIYLSYQSLLKGNYQHSRLPDVGKEYPTELQMAREALTLFRQKIFEDFPEDEVLKIALHFINAKGEEVVKQQTSLKQTISQLIETELKQHQIKRTKENSNFYDRFMIHQAYFVDRFEKQVQDSNPSLDSLAVYVQEQYPQASAIVKAIGQKISEETGLVMSKSEAVYMALHIQRLL